MGADPLASLVDVKPQYLGVAGSHQEAIRVTA